MFKKRHSAEKVKKPGIVKRFMRSFMSIVLISGFVLSVSFGIKALSEKNPYNAFPKVLSYVPKDSKVGEVAGALTKKYEEYNINSTSSVKSSDSDKNSQNIADTTESPSSSSVIDSNANRTNNDKKVKLTVAVFADSHSDITNLEKAVALAKENNVEAIFHLGDHTNLGITKDLEAAKFPLENSGIPYYAIPGDRDLWQTTGPENFLQVFGQDFHNVSIKGIDFVVFDNSRNFSKIEQSKITELYNSMKGAEFLLMSQPLYHPSNKVMGIYEGKKVVNVKIQADKILDNVRQSNVKAVITAEHHLSSEVQDPEKSTLEHIIVGAITSTINDKSQSLLQSPRFTMLKIYEDGTYELKEVLISN